MTRFYGHGWIDAQFIEPQFHFKYFAFGWVQPLPAVGMYVLFACLGGCAVGMLLGLCYRICTALFCIGFSYVFLIDQALYLNHFYLICLLTLLLVFIPAHCTWSLDSRRSPRTVAVRQDGQSTRYDPAAGSFHRIRLPRSK